MSLKIPIILFLVALAGCECVPEAETPKKIEPTNFGEARIVNCNLKYREFKLSAGDISIDRAIGYDDMSAPKEKLPAGRINLRFRSGVDVFISQLADIEKDSDYVIIAYGEKNFSRLILLSDDFSAGPPRARFALVASDLPYADFTISSTTMQRDYKILARGASQTEEFPAGVYDIKVSSESLPGQVFTEKLTIEPGYSYLIAFRGSGNASSGAPLEIYTVRTPLGD